MQEDGTRRHPWAMRLVEGGGGWRAGESGERNSSHRNAVVQHALFSTLSICMLKRDHSKMKQNAIP